MVVEPWVPLGAVVDVLDGVEVLGATVVEVGGTVVVTGSGTPKVGGGT